MMLQLQDAETGEPGSNDSKCLSKGNVFVVFVCQAIAGCDLVWWEDPSSPWLCLAGQSEKEPSVASTPVVLAGVRLVLLQEQLSNEKMLPSIVHVRETPLQGTWMRTDRTRAETKQEMQSAVGLVFESWCSNCLGY